jgi:hypothetical protein
MAKKKQKVVSVNSNQPVTQAEFSDAMGIIKHEFDHLDDRFATKEDFKQLQIQMEEMKEAIFRHFDATAESIHLDVAGTNADRVSLLENKQGEHEERLTVIEQKIGLRP